MQDTPETDKVCREATAVSEVISLARRLERERDEARRSLEILQWEIAEIGEQDSLENQ